MPPFISIRLPPLPSLPTIHRPSSRKSGINSTSHIDIYRKSTAPLPTTRSPPSVKYTAPARRSHLPNSISCTRVSRRMCCWRASRVGLIFVRYSLVRGPPYFQSRFRSCVSSPPEQHSLIISTYHTTAPPSLWFYVSSSNAYAQNHADATPFPYPLRRTKQELTPPLPSSAANSNAECLEWPSQPTHPPALPLDPTMQVNWCASDLSLVCR